MKFEVAPKSAFAAAKEANLLWEVGMEPLFLEDTTKLTASFAVRRTDTKDVLAVMGSRYTPIQNIDSMRIVDDLMGISNGLIMSAGEFNGGRKIYMQVRLPESFEVVEGDVMDRYLTVVTSHDGSLQLAVFFTAVRILCQNQMNALMMSQKNKYSFKHTKNGAKNVSVAANIMEKSNKSFADLKRICSQLRNKKITAAQEVEFGYALFPNNNRENPDTKADPGRKRREELMALISEGMGAQHAGVRGTAWSLFNAATEFYDHHQKMSGYDRSLFYGADFQKKAAGYALNV